MPREKEDTSIPLSGILAYWRPIIRRAWRWAWKHPKIACGVTLSPPICTGAGTMIYAWFTDSSIDWPSIVVGLLGLGVGAVFGMGFFAYAILRESTACGLAQKEQARSLEAKLLSYEIPRNRTHILRSVISTALAEGIELLRDLKSAQTADKKLSDEALKWIQRSASDIYDASASEILANEVRLPAGKIAAGPPPQTRQLRAAVRDTIQRLEQIQQRIERIEAKSSH